MKESLQKKLDAQNQIFPLSHKNNASINTGSVSFCICVPSPYLALLLACHHPIHIPLGGMHPLAQPWQDAAQAVDGHAPHDRRVGGFHAFE